MLVHVAPIRKDERQLLIASNGVELDQFLDHGFFTTAFDALILPRISGRVKSSDILSRRRKRVMQKVQKTYTTEFKREAVHLAQTSGKPITQIARELGISDTSIHQWRKEL